MFNRSATYATEHRELMRLGWRHVRHFGDIGTCNKGLFAGAGQNHNSHVVSDIELTADNKFLIHSTNKLTLTIAPASGLISGSFTDPASGKAVAFKGAVVETERSGAGYFLGTNASGRVRLTR